MMTETYYGHEGLHLVLEYCAFGSLRSYLDSKMVMAENLGEDKQQKQASEGTKESPGNTADCPFMGVQLDQEEATNFLCQLLSGLAYHHARGVVHEDLKACMPHLRFVLCCILPPPLT